MKKIGTIVFIFLFMISCQTVPVTGRQQLQLIPANETNAISYKTYDDFIKKSVIIKDTKEAKETSAKRLGAIAKQIRVVIEQLENIKRSSSRMVKWLSS